MMEILLSIFLICYLIYLNYLALYMNFCKKKIIHIFDKCSSILLMNDKIKSMFEETYKQLDYIEQGQSYHQKYLTNILNKLNNNNNQEGLPKQTAKNFRLISRKENTIKEFIIECLKKYNKPVTSSDILEYLIENNEFKPKTNNRGLIHIDVELRNLCKRDIVTKSKRTGQRIKWELSHGEKIKKQR